MMVPDPLRSASSMTGNPEDTSLALPSDRTLSSGRQRVLSQVQSIKRSKSKKINGTESPTSLTPTSLTSYNEFGTFKFKGNGAFGRSSSTMATSFRGMKNRSQSTKERYLSTSSTAEQQASTSVWQMKPNGLKSSRSDPALVPSGSPAVASTTSLNRQNPLGATKKSSSSMANGMIITNSQTRIIQPSYNQYEENMGTIKASRTEQSSVVNSVKSMSGLTLEDAVAYLSSPDEDNQLTGASFIQHSAYSDDSTKTKVNELKGISPLVALLESSNTKVNQAAASALRNLVFKNSENKREVQRCGISKALLLLKTTESTETQKQVTGLLWNLSSDEKLKNELTEIALPALTKNVIMPFTTGSDSIGLKHIDPIVFLNATSCLRNLSHSEEENRQKMRRCPGHIDALFSYIDACVAEEKYDDQSLENCVSIFNNLTFQLEKECPESFVGYSPTREDNQENARSKKSSSVGCFSPRSSKTQKRPPLDPPQKSNKKGNICGVEKLCHEEIIHNYLVLMEKSKNRSVLEACCGALQNLTAGGGEGASAVSEVLLQELNSMFLLPSMLNSKNQNVQLSAASLLDNMSRMSSVQSSMAKNVMPSLTKLLTSGVESMGNSDAMVKSVCNTLQRLMVADCETSKKHINTELVSALSNISTNEDLGSGSKAASELLSSMWNDKDLQGAVKKLGMEKTMFVNNTTKQQLKPSK